jgi:hypothetical protein
MFSGGKRILNAYSGNPHFDLVISRSVAKNSTDLALDITMGHDFHGDGSHAD